MHLRLCRCYRKPIPESGAAILKYFWTHGDDWPTAVVDHRLDESGLFIPELNRSAK